MVDNSYRKFVKLMAKTNADRMFLNSDEEHALEVLVQLIQLSKEKIQIFAGSLCEHIGNKPEYIVALSEFIERGGILNILLNRYDEEKAKNSNLYKRLAYYKANGKQIIVKSTKGKPYFSNDADKKEVHFTVGDRKSYRLETDIENRTAECNFNNPEIAGMIANFFDKLFADSGSEEINIEKIFDDGNK